MSREFVQESASEEFLASVSALGDRFRLHRAKHRKHHLDKIQEAIGKVEASPVLERRNHP